MVDHQASQLKALENISRDASAKPIRLSYALIESITENFAHVIGSGGFGVVYLGVLRNGQKVAVKKLSSTTDLEDDLFTDEINSLIKSHHENIVRFFGYCADTHKELVPLNEKRHVLAEVRRRFLCFEYVPEGDLHHYLKEKAHRDEWRIRFQIIKGICHGLWYLHNELICHLDMKPQNVLLDAHMAPKITDFGLSRYLDKSTINTIHIIGTPGYIPPENIDKGKISFKSDIFSLGIIIIKLLIGHDGAYDRENWHESLDLNNLQVKTCVEIARKCMDGDQHKRPAISEIIQNLGLLKSQVPSNVPEEVASMMKNVMAEVNSFGFRGQTKSAMEEMDSLYVYPTDPQIGIMTSQQDRYVRVGKSWKQVRTEPSMLTLVKGDAAARMQNEMREQFMETSGKDGQAVLYVTNLGILRKTCDDCRTIRVALMSLRVEFTEKDADTEEPKQLFLDRPAFRLPVLCKGKHFIEGSELMKLHNEGKLAALIK